MDRKRFIIENYATMPTEEMAEILGSSVSSVRTTACKLGLKKSGNNKDLAGEVWKEHAEYPDYFISNKGRIKSKVRERIMFQREHEGYMDARIKDKDGHKRSPRIHRLVADLFVNKPDTDEKLIVNHIDGNKLNNCAENLEWSTYADNYRHAAEQGLMGYRTGTTPEEKIREICSLLESGHSINAITKRDKQFTRSVVESVRQRTRWTTVSKQYKW
jgi:hypothetical protein